MGQRATSKKINEIRYLAALLQVRQREMSFKNKDLHEASKVKPQDPGGTVGRAGTTHCRPASRSSPTWPGITPNSRPAAKSLGRGTLVRRVAPQPWPLRHPLAPQPTMNFPGAALALSLFALSACSTPEGPASNPFHASDSFKTALRSPRPLQDDRLTWSLATKFRLRASALLGNAPDGALMTIAHREAHDDKPCRNLDLVAIKGLPLKPFTVRASVQDAPRTYHPINLLEEWEVTTCGRHIHWLVFNDEQDPVSNLTLLRSEGPWKALES